jgi:hypothetical protein
MSKAIVIFGAVMLGVFLAMLATHHQQPQQVQQVQNVPATFTWEGTTWNCAQVAQWNQQYGAYEPDGTPIPYEVIGHCTLP